MANLNPTQLRHRRIRKRVHGTPERPRLAVHFSGQHIYAQVIDDRAGRTIAAANTTDKEFKGDKTVRPNKETAERVGRLIAERSKSKNVARVVFDRGGYLYHGKVKALADAARDGGLDF
jgi:large subunit ribosomal protein L18